MITGIVNREHTGTQCLEKPLWKALWTCHKTNYAMHDRCKWKWHEAEACWTCITDCVMIIFETDDAMTRFVSGSKGMKCNSIIKMCQLYTLSWIMGPLGFLSDSKVLGCNSIRELHILLTVHLDITSG